MKSWILALLYSKESVEFMHGMKIKKNLIKILQLIGKASIRINLLKTTDNFLPKIYKIFRDKEVKFIIDILEIVYLSKDNISNEVAEFINKIGPKVLKINGKEWTFQDMKAVVMLNCTKIFLNVKIVECIINFYLWFRNTPVQFFDFNSNQRLTFEWKSINFSIMKYDIKDVQLLKINGGNFLFIPTDTIHRISCSGLREILSANDISKQYADFGDKHQFNTNGFIVPMGCSNWIFIKLGDDYLHYLNQMTDIYHIFDEKYTELKICSLDRLLEINKLLPDNFSNINIKYFNKSKTEIAKYSISEIMDSIDWINLKFIEIYQPFVLT